MPLLAKRHLALAGFQNPARAAKLPPRSPRQQTGLSLFLHQFADASFRTHANFSSVGDKIDFLGLTRVNLHR